MEDAKKVEKRERILDAAVAEIAAHGYYNTTVAMIARRAGVADGTIYLYFENKQAILVAIFERAVGRLLVLGRRSISGQPGARDRLRRVVELHLDLVGRDRDLAVIYQVELRHNLHFLEIFSHSRIREYLQIIAEIIAQGQAEGVFRKKQDALLAAKAVFGVLDEMVTDWVLSRRETPLNARADEVVDLVMAMVAV